MNERRFFVLVGMLLALGCGASVNPRGTVSESLAIPWVGEKQRPAAAARSSADPPERPAPRYRSASIPGGITCLLRLQGLGVAHRAVARARLPHVITPVELTGGEVGGVRYRATSRRVRLLCDCRLALALHRAGPTLRLLGVSEVRYSNTYRAPASGRPLSRHAMGLAIDVHQLVIAGELLDVRDDYRAGYQPERCADAVAPLNAVACQLARRGLFDRVLTPDTDAAHRDHFHWAIVSFERRRQPRRRRPSPVIVD